MKKWLLRLSLCLLLIFSAVPRAMAVETEAPVQTPVEINTAEDLFAIAEDPAGSYILMADLDMTGISWTPIDFSGSFDGNGHAILNLFLAETGKETAVVS